MLKNELYKIFTKKSIWFVLTICIILEIFFACNMNSIMYKGYVKKIYKYYIQQLEGQYTEEKYNWIISERDRLYNLIDSQDEFEEKYSNDEIEQEEYLEKHYEIVAAKEKLPTVEYIVEKSEYFKSMGGKGTYFYDVEIADYVSNMKIDLFAVVSVIIIITLIFTDDYECELENLIKTSVNGRSRLFRTRVICALFISAVLGVMYPIIEFIVKYIKFDLGDMNASILSIYNMRNCFLDVSISNYIFLTIIVKVIYSTFLSIIVVMISSAIHKNMNIYMITLGLVFVPSFVYQNTNKYLKQFFLCHGLSSTNAFCDTEIIKGFNGLILAIAFYISVSFVFIKQYEKRNI